MKIRIDVDTTLEEDEIIIHCKNLNEDILNLQKTIVETTAGSKRIVFYKGEVEYYLPLEEILFFETEGNEVFAHTVKEMYRVKHKLYELEEILPALFMRVSKSTIMNVEKVYSIDRKISAASIVEFQGTHKQVYVSRYYYKPLKNRLEEKRITR